MQNENLKNELFLLTGYLLTSAHGLYQEPKGYGPFRLLDAAGRLLALMRSHDMSDDFLAGIEQQIENERFAMNDDQHLQETLNQMCLNYAAEMEKRIENDETVS